VFCVTTANRICPAAAMPSCPVAASAITWCDGGPWRRGARSRLIDLHRCGHSGANLQGQAGTGDLRPAS
jgi:hypothetical protein